MKLIKGKIYKVKSTHKIHRNRLGRFEYFGSKAILSDPASRTALFAVNFDDLEEPEAKTLSCTQKEVSMIEGHDGPVTVGWIRRMLASLPDDKVVQFSTLCFNRDKVPEIIEHCFIGGGYDGTPIIFDLCEKVEKC